MLGMDVTAGFLVPCDPDAAHGSFLIVQDWCCYAMDPRGELACGQEIAVSFDPGQGLAEIAPGAAQPGVLNLGGVAA